MSDDALFLTVEEVSALGNGYHVVVRSDQEHGLRHGVVTLADPGESVVTALQQAHATSRLVPVRADFFEVDADRQAAALARALAP